MIDWQDKIERSKLVCARSEQAIEPGHYYYSTLHMIDGRFVRQDFSEEAWQADDSDGCLSWWHHRRPVPLSDKGPSIVNHQILLQIFTDIKDTTDRQQQCFAWLLALLLMRAKKLRYLDLEKDTDGTWLVIEDKHHRTAYRIRDPGMTKDEEQAVLADLSEVFDMPLLEEDQGEVIANR